MDHLFDTHGIEDFRRQVPLYYVGDLDELHKIPPKGGFRRKDRAGCMPEIPDVVASNAFKFSSWKSWRLEDAAYKHEIKLWRAQTPFVSVSTKVK